MRGTWWKEFHKVTSRYGTNSGATATTSGATAASSGRLSVSAVGEAPDVEVLAGLRR